MTDDVANQMPGGGAPATQTTPADPSGATPTPVVSDAPAPVVPAPAATEPVVAETVATTAPSAPAENTPAMEESAEAPANMPTGGTDASGTGGMPPTTPGATA